MSARPYLIGLTGNIATGKSTVAEMLASLGAQVIDADQVVHELMRAGTPVWRSIVERFGQGILAPDGEIDRRKLGAVVFANRRALRALEKIVHPAVTAEVDRRIMALAEQAAKGNCQAPVIVIEAVKLVEAGMHRRYDALWVVTCSPEVQKARLMARGNLSEAEVEARLRAQPPLAPKLALADVVIDNSGSLDATRSQVETAWAAIMHRCLDKKGDFDKLN